MLESGHFFHTRDCGVKYFLSEFVALRVATELIEGLRYKLRIFGVPIDGATSVYCDNQSVTKNATVPASTLSKKHNLICYHKIK